MAESSVELVITAPESYIGPLAYQTRCRTTLGVLCQLFTQAKHHVIIAAPFIQFESGLTDSVLADAMRSSLQRGVNVDVLSTGQSLQAIDWDRLVQGSSGKLRLFRPSANLVDENKLGSHAKVCIADGKSAYVGSANLTWPGLSGQLEIGLLVNGKVARQIEEFWDNLIEGGFFLSVK
jgi:phosphatidylserine/phosphatidylglycerophosphate/cardiolipin synthase-like enzyme